MKKSDGLTLTWDCSPMKRSDGLTLTWDCSPMKTSDGSTLTWDCSLMKERCFLADPGPRAILQSSSSRSESLHVKSINGPFTRLLLAIYFFFFGLKSFRFVVISLNTNVIQNRFVLQHMQFN